MRGFLKSVFMGTIAGATLPICLTVPLGIANLVSPLTGHLDILGSVFLAVSPILISFAFVLICSTLIGLPATALLKHFALENHDNYVMTGVISGSLVVLIPLLFAGAIAGFWIGIPGALAGGVTGHYWSLSRERRVR